MNMTVNSKLDLHWLQAQWFAFSAPTQARNFYIWDFQYTEYLIGNHLSPVCLAKLMVLYHWRLLSD